MNEPAIRWSSIDRATGLSRALRAAFVAGLLLLPSAAGLFADPPAPGAAPAAAAGAWTKAELKELVGPVALYPDVVLASLLPATAYPLDLVQAARYVEEEGGKVEAAPEGVSWDGCVVAMLQFPDVLKWLNENLEWVEQMGHAVATQNAEVLGAIQEFREETQKAGNLKTDEYMKVEEIPPAPDPATGEVPANSQQIIVIEQAQPEVLYVPTYNPTTVVQPYVGTAPLYGFGVGLAVGVAGAWAYNNFNWGWNNGGGWHGGDINVNNTINNWSGGRPSGGWNNNGGNRWNAPTKPGGWNRPGGAGSQPVRPNPRPPGKNPGPGNRPGGGSGVKPPAGGRPGTGGPGSRPGGGGAKPSQLPANGQGGFGGAGTGKGPANNASNRGGNSLGGGGAGAGGANRPSGGGAGKPGGGAGGGAGKPAGGGGGAGKPAGGGGGARPSQPSAKPPAKSGGNAYGGSSGSSARSSSSRGARSSGSSGGGRSGGGGGGGRGGGGGGRRR